MALTAAHRAVKPTLTIISNRLFYGDFAKDLPVIDSNDIRSLNRRYIFIFRLKNWKEVFSFAFWSWTVARVGRFNETVGDLLRFTCYQLNARYWIVVGLSSKWVADALGCNNPPTVERRFCCLFARRFWCKHIQLGAAASLFPPSVNFIGKFIFKQPTNWPRLAVDVLWILILTTRWFIVRYEPGTEHLAATRNHYCCCCCCCCCCWLRFGKGLIRSDRHFDFWRFLVVPRHVTRCLVSIRSVEFQ